MSSNGALPMSAVKGIGAIMTEPEASPEKIRIAAVGDLHVKDDQSVSMREIFADASRNADILVLAGDLTEHGRPREAEILAEELRSCSIPVIGVLGNHDVESGHADEIKSVLHRGGMHVLDGDIYELHGVGFVGVKGFGGGFGRRMLGAFGEPAIKAFVNESVNEALRLESAMHAMKNDRIVVVLHYSPISGTLEGEPPEIWPFLGSTRLADTIDRFEVKAVLHGHAHYGTYQANTLTGIPVYNVSMPVAKPSGKAYGLIIV
jgi:uncharacterized protein